MCGIVAIADFAGKTIPGGVVGRMTAALHHRGPDDGGFAHVDPASGECLTWTSDLPAPGEMGGVLFGHRRLNILDLSAAGHQPLLSDDGSIVLVYNGEVYNFIEIREELKARGVAFRSSGDTEVVLRAYEEWGENAFTKFNGMWALALWDGRQRKLVVSRDRFGIKPLHYAVIDGTWVFASEIKALLLYPGVWRGFDDERVSDFLVHTLVNQDEGSLFRGIRSVPPGGCMELSARGSRIRRFWSLPTGASAEVTGEKDAVERFRQLLLDSVRLRMRSDVPIGTMLSGGLDSASITALVRELKRSSNSGDGTAWEGFRNVHHTFSACWPGWRGDEEADVDQLSSELDLRSHKLNLRAEEVPSLLPEVVRLLDEPFHSPIPVVQYLLMRRARDHGVKVVLNGHGSDEVWAGYPQRFVPRFLADLFLSGRFVRGLKEYQAFRATGEWTTRKFLAVCVGGLTPSPLRSRALRFYRRRRGQVAEIFPDARLYYSGNTRNSDGLSLLGEALRVCFTQTVLPMWLRMEDRVSMACSVESRLPFLDHRLIEFGFALADDLRLRDGYTKFILREAVKDVLPANIVSNRRKQRFQAPAGQWLEGALRPMLQDLFYGPCNVQPYLDLTRFRERLRAYLAGSKQALNSRLLWRVLNVELWMQAYANSPKAHSWHDSVSTVARNRLHVLSE